ncbi:hypothetical protein [Fibrella forsythiae]|uniref:hypothetical protein n=1 Tax=Fibrella forsythiae TaxID=2817061 RepID=UPI001E3A7493|nr:hypothetical protein [Fibrella forsythiae]
MAYYGRTAFFYYTIHWFVLHTLRMLVFFAAGHTMTEADKVLQTIPVRFVLPGEGGYNLGGLPHLDSRCRVVVPSVSLV